MEKQCPHKFTYKTEDLFRANSILSKKECELCGKTIVLDRKYKVYLIMFIFLLIVCLLLTPNLLNAVFTDVSYLAKGMVAVLAFVVIYSFGIYKIMNKATYKTYEPPQRVGEEVYQESKNKAQEKVYNVLKKDKPEKLDD